MAIKTGSELIIIIRKEDGKPVVYHLYSANGDFAQNVINVGDPRRVKEVENFLDRGSIRYRMNNREFVIITGTFQGMPVTVIGTGIGPSNTAITTIEVHAVHECNFTNGQWVKKPIVINNIRCGTCGSSHPEGSINTLGNADYCLGLDGVGPHYPHYSINPFVRKLEKAFRKACWESIKKVPFLELWPHHRPQLRMLTYQRMEKTALLLSENAAMEWAANYLKKYFFSFFRPYATMVAPAATNAIEVACKLLKFPFLTGIDIAADDFYGGQGRSVGRANEILLPELQRVVESFELDGVRPVFNEMEGAPLGRIGYETLGYNVGCVCLIIANRRRNEFISDQEKPAGIQRCILTGLVALLLLNNQQPKITARMKELELVV